MTAQHAWTVAIWRSMRPGQWQKNLIAYAPLLFSAGSAWDPGDGAVAAQLLGRATLGFVLLCLAASGGYLLNDAHDAGADRLHPTKRLRPVAAGRLPIDGAISAGAGLIFAGLTIAAFTSTPLFTALGAYAALTLAYSLLLRRFAGLDVIAVAGGFALRAVVGAEAIAVPVSTWILVCTALGAAYVVLVKREQERALLHEAAARHRPSQRTYGERGAGRLAPMVAVAAVLAYTAYTWTASNLPPNHAMVLTVPLVALGLVRYRIAARRAPERNADELLVRDPLLLLTVIAFAVLAFAVLVFAR
ncbi:MAG: UbiA prenyltransferase family protein [Dehalococcoidia bacterium]